MDTTLIERVKKLHDEGATEQEVASKLGYESIAKLRRDICNARKERKDYLVKRVHELYDAGKKVCEISKKLGISEARVNYYINNTN